MTSAEGDASPAREAPPPPRRILGLPPAGWEILAAVAIVAWRAARAAWHDPASTRAIPELWRDWVVWVAVYWIFTALARRSRLWPPVTAVVMLGLMLTYLCRQLPFSFEALRWGLVP